MSEEITTQTINPFYLSVVKFKDRGFGDKREGTIMLEYKNRDIYVLQNTIFYQLLRLLKLPIAEYRKFANHDKSRLLNVYFRTLSSSLIWDIDISKRQETYRYKKTGSFPCSIYSVFSIRKAIIEKEKEKQIKKKAQPFYNSKQDQFAKENPVVASMILVVIAFLLYFLMIGIGGS